MKYKIEKNTVQETLILPLYSRKLCTELYPNLYLDETAVHLIETRSTTIFRCWRRSRAASCSALDFWRPPCGRTTWRGRCGRT